MWLDTNSYYSSDENLLKNEEKAPVTYIKVLQELLFEYQAYTAS